MAPTCKARVLIVDDETAIVDFITNILSTCAYDIRAAYNGEQAVSIAREFHPDCVVTGFMMPGMDGLQKAAAILQFQPTCKFVFVTSNAQNPTVREQYERLGLDLNLLLDKPFDRRDILNALALAGFFLFSEPFISIGLCQWAAVARCPPVVVRPLQRLTLAHGE
jgi:CheY-like chemotaxis protein